METDPPQAPPLGLVRRAWPRWATVRDRLRSLAAAGDRGPVSAWFRAGTPIALLAVGIWLLPLMGAGIVRNLTGVSTEVGLPIALGAGVLLVALLRARPRTPAGARDPATRQLQLVGLVIGVLMIIGAISLFHSRDMGVVPTYFGPDAGSHVGFRELFIASDRHSYFGFISLYSVTHLLKRVLPGPPTRAWAAAFYPAVAMVVVVPVIAMVALLQSERAPLRARLMGLVVFGAGWFLGLRNLALPLLANMEMDGFFGHLFGFLPFGLVWVADVVARPRLLRLIGVAMGVALCRFTYGLNLGDLLVTCGCLWLADAWGARRRPVFLLAGLGAIGASVVAYMNLAPPFKIGGYVEVYDLDTFVASVWTAALVLGTYAAIDAWPGRRSRMEGEPEVPGGLSSVVRFPVVLALASMVALGRFSTIPRCESYYRLKYPMMPAVWLAAAACIVMGQVVTRAVSRTGRPTQALAGIVAIIVLVRVADKTDPLLATLQAELAERNGPLPHPKLRPILAEEVWNDVQGTLRSEAKAFGGLVSHDYAASRYLNAEMGFQNITQGYVAPDQTPGHCVFWTHAKDDMPFAWHLAPGAVEASRGALEADPAKICRAHHTAWTLVPRELCHRCY